MQSKVRVFGHAVHPMLVDFPIVCFPLLVACDVADRMGWLATGKVPLLLDGIGGGVAVLAILTGAIDFFALPRATRARRVAALHFALGVVIWGVYGLSSGGHTGTSPTTLGIVIDVLGTLLVFVQGYLGGELLERHHVGVKTVAEGADPVTLRGKST